MQKKLFLNFNLDLIWINVNKVTVGYVIYS